MRRERLGPRAAKSLVLLDGAESLCGALALRADAEHNVGSLVTDEDERRSGEPGVRKSMFRIQSAGVDPVV